MFCKYAFIGLRDMVNGCLQPSLDVTVMGGMARGDTQGAATTSLVNQHVHHRERQVAIDKAHWVRSNTSVTSVFRCVVESRGQKIGHGRWNSKQM